MKRSLHVLLVCLYLVSTIQLRLFIPQPASALTGSSFNPGRIIDDAIFFNPASMTPQDIQAFLASKNPSCDTNGTKPISSGSSTTRAQWAAQNNKPLPPYTCLKDFSQSVPARGPDEYCSGSVSAGVKTAAEIIKSVADACSINPQVIIVLLQKEQSLITDEWPWPRQLEAATGYSCPDTAPCDPEFAGFFNQVYYGTRQFQRYAKSSSSFNYRATRSSYVLYNPNAGCGGTNVYIQNQATAGLYNYTPYQPNGAALSNLYGTGDDCSAYGNRNFWRMFNDWFGTTIGDRPIANVSWNFENLEGGQNSLKPTANTVGLTPKTITFNNALYVFYYDSTQQVLRMAKADANGWSYSILDGNATNNGRIVANVGQSVVATLHNTELHIFYYDGTNSSLRHGWLNTSGTWQFETLDGTTTAVSAYDTNLGMSNAVVEQSGKLHLFYYDAVKGNLRHATHATTEGWRFENLDGDYGSIAGLNSDVGQNPSAAVVAGSVQLFYYDVQNGNLRHAWVNPGSSWRFENLDGDYGSVSGRDGLIGQDPTVIEHGGGLQLFYYDVQNGNLRHAWVNPGSSWRFENLDGDYGSVSGLNGNRGSMANALSFKNALYVFYRDNSAGTVHYAWADSGGWHFAPLEGQPFSVSGQKSNTGFWPTATGYGDSLQLYYFDNDQRSLRHAFGNPYW